MLYNIIVILYIYTHTHCGWSYHHSSGILPTFTRFMASDPIIFPPSTFPTYFGQNLGDPKNLGASQLPDLQPLGWSRTFREAKARPAARAPRPPAGRRFRRPRSAPQRPHQGRPRHPRGPRCHLDRRAAPGGRWMGRPGWTNCRWKRTMCSQAGKARLGVKGLGSWDGFVVDFADLVWLVNIFGWILQSVWYYYFIILSSGYQQPSQGLIL